MPSSAPAAQATGPDPRRAVVLADEIEAAAFADMYEAAPPAIGAIVVRIDGATALIAPGVPTPMFNRAIGLGLSQPARFEAVADLQARYRAAGVGRWWLHWSPAAAPGGFDRSLAARRFAVASRRSWAKMLRGCDRLPAAQSTLAVRPTTPTGRARTAGCIALAFGMPPVIADWLVALHGRERWRAFSLVDGDEIVGGAFLFIADSTGWLGMGAVLPSHRRRGGQQALMVHRIAAAASEGCRHVVTETGEPVGDEPNPSLANMGRVGFEKVASRLNLEWSQA